MDDLLNALIDIIELLPPERLVTLADEIRATEGQRTLHPLLATVVSPAAKQAVERLGHAWRETEVPSGELASMLMAASRAHETATARQIAELVWTGPTTAFVSTRRTDQSLLEVIRSATHALFVTSFVAYDVTIVIEALNQAVARGVDVSILLESSLDQGGSITFDVIGAMRTLVPSAQLYAWKAKPDRFDGGRVHAKVSVADRRICFITSANLTGHALDKNMEAGVLIRGGSIPDLLHQHLNALVETRVVSPV